MTSLLASFYSRIKGSQEDIASSALTYILQRSGGAKKALSNLIKNDCQYDCGEINYHQQQTGEFNERPDISGFDENRREVLTIEAKFWAALTENQPLEYVKRLHGKSTLLFVCPDSRVRSLFDELSRRILLAYPEAIFDSDNHKIIIEDKFILVKSWSIIFRIIRIELVKENNQILLADIDQVIGLSDYIDKNSFLPIQTEDLSPLFARRITSFYALIDKAVDELKKRGLAKTDGLKSTAQRFGYTRYFLMGKLGVAFELDFTYWGSKADTPFWLTFREGTSNPWKQTKEVFNTIRGINKKGNYVLIEEDFEVYIGLFPAFGKNEDDVVSGFVGQIVEFYSANQQTN